MRSIYLDYSSTTPIAASVRESMLPFLGELFGHPSSSNWIGRAAEEAIEDARSNLASLLNCHPSEIIFTSGGTEAANLGLLGVARAIRSSIDGDPHFITTRLEHAAVRGTAQQLSKEGWKVSTIGCTSDGVVNVEELASAVRDSTRLVSVIHANHQIGTIQPIAEIADICQQHDILLHTDAAQTVGKIECDVEALGVDMLSLSGHKFYAPMGIGALYLRMGVPIESIMYGEGAEAGIRPGTPNVPHIAGLGQAAKLAISGLQSSIDRVEQLRQRFFEELQSMVGRPLRVHGLAAERLPGILSLELPGVTAEALQRRMPEICFGPTTPCMGRARHVTDGTLSAIGLTTQQIANTLRISIGWSSSEDELHRAAHAIATAYDALTEC